MMIKKTLLTISCLYLLSSLQAQLQSPSEFLPHQWGEQFTPHHMLVDYMEHVATNSENVLLTTYGHTNENRPLLLAYISTPENLKKLEDIRTNNLRRAGFLPGEVNPELDEVIVWLSFSVHGNEPAGSESSMQVIYELADPNHAQTQKWLENAIVVFDPCINPDGYSRYTHWYRGFSNATPNPHPDAAEHREPWPGGRVNHYLFDLNRDWAWQTQVESQQRLEKYQQWLPQIHADLHEMGRNSHYYFAPGARPYHEYITDWQADFQKTIGQNHAKYFDKNGWLYFTREVYDLLYPSYGDTYPTYHGAIGMTYEQAGGGGAGRAVILENGDTLTLMDRVKHHRATALSTIEIASMNAEKLLEEFGKYHQQAQKDPPGDYKTYVIKGSNGKGKLKAFTTLLDKNQIQYGMASSESNRKGYHYTSGQESSLRIEKGDLLISAHQPKAVMTQILMEPQTALEDSLTYDITAWSLPYAFGLNAYAIKEKVNVEPGFPFATADNKFPDRPYAYLLRWESLLDAQFLSQVLAAGVKARFSEKAFSLEGLDYAPGTVIFSRSDNRKLGADFDRIIQEKAQKSAQSLQAVKTGMVSSGSDLGARSMQLIQTPRIAVATGEGVYSNSYGQVWYYLEQNLGYPFTPVTAQNLSRTDLDDYNVLIFPEGYFDIDEDLGESLSDWISKGGRLIAIGAANRLLNRIGSLGLKSGNSNNEEEEDELSVYSERRRESASNNIPGAIFQLKMDKTHPLAFGMGDTYFSLKTSRMAYPYQENMWNVGTIGENPLVLGFAGYKIKKRQQKTTVFGVKSRGQGAVIYMVDNPLFRGFWENGKFLFSNALFFAGQ